MTKLVSSPQAPRVWSLDAGAGVITVTIGGELDQREAECLEVELRERVAPVGPGSVALVFDLNQLQRCSIAARGVLAALQRRLGTVVRRTAYVTSRPLFRGVALWICHSAPDSNARTFPTVEAALPWLASNEPRGEALQRSAATWLDSVAGLRHGKGVTA